MASYCPNCNYKLSIKDWRPNCPKCGVNILYFGIEDRLREEADAAEYHHAMSQPKFDRLKFSAYGTPYAIVRIIIGLLPIVATLIPAGTIKYLLPFAANSLGDVPAKSVNLVSIIQMFTGKSFDFNVIMNLTGSKLLGSAMICWLIALAGLLLALVVSLVGYVCAITLSCSPKGFKRNIAFPIIGIVLSVVSYVGFTAMTFKLNAALPGVFEGKASPLMLLGLILAFGVNIAVAIIYKKKNIPVKYTDVSEFLLPYNERPSTIEKQKAKENAAKSAESQDTAEEPAKE